MQTTKDLEAALDSQVIGALAPGARIVIYEAPDDERGFLDAIRTALFDEEFKPSILSISYGWPEHLWTAVAIDILNELFTVAALVGVSVFCSSGDNGAELDYDGKPHVLAPAASPFVHACGATAILSDSGNEIESAWEKTGGGFSEHFDVPPWQNIATSVAAANTVDAGRGVPDIAAQQQPGYCVYLDGVELAMGGTSAVAPMWSALAARINQRLGVPIGLISPILYASGEKIFQRNYQRKQRTLSSVRGMESVHRPGRSARKCYRGGASRELSALIHACERVVLKRLRCRFIFLDCLPKPVLIDARRSRQFLMKCVNRSNVFIQSDRHVSLVRIDHFTHLLG